MNLIQNSIEAMEAGGKINITCNRDNGFADITVWDTGTGIPDGIRAKIFLPFFTTKGKGTGLGLAIVHRLVASHGGSIELCESPQGTAFRIKLPIGSS